MFTQFCARLLLEINALPVSWVTGDSLHVISVARIGIQAPIHFPV